MKTKKFTLEIFFLLASVLFNPVFAKEGDAQAKGIAGVDHAHWLNRLTVSGVLEVEANWAESFAGTKASDITLATVELGFDANINQRVDAHLTFLYEEDDTNYELDEGYISIVLENAVNIQAGQLYVPFGSYETNLVSDPLTLAVGESRESVFLVSWDMGDLHISAYTFNGSTQEIGKDDKLDQLGVSMAYVTAWSEFSMDVGIDYINNVADSDSISAEIEVNTGAQELAKYVPAQVIHANFTFGYAHLILEHLSTEKFATSELAFASKGAEVTATNVEAGYTMLFLGLVSTVSIAIQSTEEAVGLGLPKEKHLLASSINIARDSALRFEYAVSKDYSIADGGTGKDAHSITAQLSVGF